MHFSKARAVIKRQAKAINTAGSQEVQSIENQGIKIEENHEVIITEARITQDQLVSHQEVKVTGNQVQWIRITGHQEVHSMNIKTTGTLGFMITVVTIPEVEDIMDTEVITGHQEVTLTELLGMNIAGIPVVETTGDQEMDGTEVQEITLGVQEVENTEGNK